MKVLCDVYMQSGLEFTGLAFADSMIDTVGEARDRIDAFLHDDDDENWVVFLFPDRTELFVDHRRIEAYRVYLA